MGASAWIDFYTHTQQSESGTLSANALGGNSLWPVLAPTPLSAVCVFRLVVIIHGRLWRDHYVLGECT